jgi:FkbM family methyltransferase
MNKIERFVDEFSPRLSVRLRWLKHRILGEGGLLVLARFVRPGDCVADIGAHRGIYTYRLAQLVGPRGHVHAFDPVPSNAAALEALRGGAQNMTIHQVALSDHAGEANLHIPIFAGHEVDALASLRGCEDVHRTVAVKLERLDAILPPDRASLSFIKCDVEGHEYAALRGAVEILRESKPTLLIEIEQRHQDRDIREIFAYLQSFDYRGFFLDGTRARPIEEFDVQRHQLAFVTADFVPYDMPRGYVCDFVFVNPETLKGRGRSALNRSPAASS